MFWRADAGSRGYYAGGLVPPWQETYARGLGEQAYVWAFPWLYLTQLCWLWTSEAGKNPLAAKNAESGSSSTSPWAPMNTFWSITMYNSATLTLASDTNYTINSYDPEYQARKPDGSMTSYLQPSQPENQSSGTYWLKSPAAASRSSTSGFYLIMRVYVPGPTVSGSQSWVPPAIQRLSAPTGK